MAKCRGWGQSSQIFFVKQQLQYSFFYQTGKKKAKHQYKPVITMFPS